MSRWNIEAVGEFRRQDRGDGTTALWLAGWKFADDTGQRATVHPAEDDSPHLIHPTCDVGDVVLFGYTLAELEARAAGHVA